MMVREKSAPISDLEIYQFEVLNWLKLLHFIIWTDKSLKMYDTTDVNFKNSIR